MPRPPVRLPPLNALRAFWSVMRHGSFRAAAEELSVSPQAVSQQIKTLEEALGVTLFSRQGRAITPTEPAVVLAHFVETGFEELAEGVRRVTAPARRNRITINVSPYFASHFLIGRLARFHERLPQADLRLTTRIEMPDFAADEVDVGIQWGFGTWVEHQATLLVSDPKIICCAPALAERVHSASDLRTAPLLHPLIAASLWDHVFAHLRLGDEPAPRGIELHDAEMMRRAAISGMGVGLVSRADVADDLAAGRLVAPLGLDALTGMDPRHIPGFYLVVPRGARRARAVLAFIAWAEGEDWAA